jgi:hypothetical protein
MYRCTPSPVHAKRVKEDKQMLEYRVDTYTVRRAAEEMNRMAAEGWHVIAVCPNQARCFGVIVTYERQK